VVGICCHTFPKSGFRFSGVDVVGVVEDVTGSGTSVLEVCVVGAVVVVVGTTVVAGIRAGVVVAVLERGAASRPAGGAEHAAARMASVAISTSWSSTP